MKPSGAGAVMADRARGEVPGDSEQQALWRRLEFFPTAPWAARAIGEAIAALDPGRWWCWEPACGEGHMAAGLAGYFERVYATDIHDHGGPLQHGPPLDFLSPAADRIDQADWIVTNPPFGKAADFTAAALRRARRGVAMLCRSGWLDTAGRYPMFFGAGLEGRTCDLELAFFDRVPMSLGKWEPKSTEPGGSSATPYSLFVWFQDVARPTWLDDVHAIARANLPLAVNRGVAPIPGMGGGALLTLGIPPGTKARLTHADDARLWGVKRDTPLFERSGGRQNAG